MSNRTYRTWGIDLRLWPDVPGPQWAGILHIGQEIPGWNGVRMATWATRGQARAFLASRRLTDTSGYWRRAVIRRVNVRVAVTR